VRRARGGYILDSRTRTALAIRTIVVSFRSATARADGANVEEARARASELLDRVEFRISEGEDAELVDLLESARSEIQS
jgi:hypothetical protein